MATPYDNMTKAQLIEVCQKHDLKGYSAKDPDTGKSKTVEELRQFVKERLAPPPAPKGRRPAASQFSRGSVSQGSVARPKASGISALCNKLASTNIAHIGGFTIDWDTIMNATPSQLKSFVNEDLPNRTSADTPSFGVITSKNQALNLCKEHGNNSPMAEYVMALYGQTASKNMNFAHEATSARMIRS